MSAGSIKLTYITDPCRKIFAANQRYHKEPYTHTMQSIWRMQIKYQCLSNMEGFIINVNF